MIPTWSSLRFRWGNGWESESGARPLSSPCSFSATLSPPSHTPSLAACRSAAPRRKTWPKLQLWTCSTPTSQTGSCSTPKSLLSSIPKKLIFFHCRRGSQPLDDWHWCYFPSWVWVPWGEVLSYSWQRGETCRCKRGSWIYWACVPFWGWSPWTGARK